MYHFRHTRSLARVALVLLLFTLTGLASTAAGGATPVDSDAPEYPAEACLIAPDLIDEIECFDSEKELDRRLDELLLDLSPRACTGTIRLYDQPNFGTPMLAVVAGATWVNLSTFDNRTSSFRIGACDALLALDPSGGGLWYPTSQSTAGTSKASLNAPWNNAISSVRSD